MRFNVVTFNTFTSVPEPVRFLGQRTRLKRMAPELAALAGGDVDVIVINEGMVPSTLDDLLQPLADLGFEYCTSPLQSEHVGPTFISGGVYILSRHPIVQEAQHVFESKCGADALAAKGVVFARILKENKVFNVLGTHMQAWDTAEGQKVRVQQALEIRRFIDRIAVPAVEPLLLAGDLNIDREHKWAELQNFLHITQMNMPPTVGEERFTVTNDNQLYGNDDPGYYANKQWPNGCFDVYLDTLRCVCCESQWDDYVLHSRVHEAPLARSASMAAIPIRSEPYSCQINLTTWRTMTDLSDHYSVLGQFTFPDAVAQNPRSTTLCRRRQQHQNRHSRAAPPVSPPPKCIVPQLRLPTLPHTPQLLLGGASAYEAPLPKQRILAWPLQAKQTLTRCRQKVSEWSSRSSAVFWIVMAVLMTLLIVIPWIIFYRGLKSRVKQ